MLAAIAFDNNIRGILVVVVAVLVLIGSIIVPLATNSGIRVGFLIGASGLFGWMFLLGGAWWMYGIGLKGRDPSWMPLEINFDRGSPIATGAVESLPAPEALPDPVELMEKYPLLFAVAKGSEGADFEPKTLSKVVTLITPLVTLTPEQFEGTIQKGLEANATDYLAAHPEAQAVLDGPTDEAVAEISKQAEALRTEIQDGLGGWCLLSESDPRRGDAAAAADAELASAKAFGDPTTSASYIPRDVFFLGGKEPCQPITEQSSLQQAWHRVRTTAQLKAPRLYSVVTVTKAKQVVTPPGETPAPPSVQPGVKSVSVVQLRNLGNRRLIPFFFMLVNGILFTIFVIMLHTRDKASMAARAAFAASKK